MLTTTTRKYSRLAHSLMLLLNAPYFLPSHFPFICHRQRSNSKPRASAFLFSRGHTRSIKFGFIAHVVRTNPPVVLQPGFPETSGAEFWGFAELFQKRPLHAQWRSPRRRTRRFFSIVFLCACFVKEKRLKSLGMNI